VGYLEDERSFRDAAAADYDDTFGSYQTREERATVATAPVWGRVLDHGSGTARFADLLVGRASQLVALDLSAASLAIAGRRGEEVVQGSVISLPFRSGAFDAVVSVQVLEHLLDPEHLAEALREVDRVLAVGGTATLTVYNLHLFDRVRGRRAEDTPSHRFVRHSRAALAALLHEAFDGASITVRGQCHFLRRGTGAPSRWPRAESVVRRLPASHHLASFLVAEVRKVSGHHC